MKKILIYLIPFTLYLIPNTSYGQVTYKDANASAVAVQRLLINTNAAGVSRLGLVTDTDTVFMEADAGNLDIQLDGSVSINGTPIGSGGADSLYIKYVLTAADTASKWVLNGDTLLIPVSSGGGSGLPTAVNDGTLYYYDGADADTISASKMKWSDSDSTLYADRFNASTMTPSMSGGVYSTKFVFSVEPAHNWDAMKISLNNTSQLGIFTAFNTQVMSFSHVYGNISNYNIYPTTNLSKDLGRTSGFWRSSYIGIGYFNTSLSVNNAAPTFSLHVNDGSGYGGTTGIGFGLGSSYIQERSDGELDIYADTLRYATPPTAASADSVWGAVLNKFVKVPAPSGSGGASQLSELSDINTSTPTNRNLLIADGTDWESRALLEADISDFGTYLSSAIGTDDQVIVNQSGTLVGDNDFKFDGLQLNLGTGGSYGNTSGIAFNLGSSLIYESADGQLEIVSNETQVTGGFVVQGTSGFDDVNVGGDLDVSNGVIEPGSATIIDNDATPDMTSGNIYTYAGTANSVTLTDLDNPVVGAIYEIIGNSDTYKISIANSGNFTLRNNWVGGDGDAIRLYVRADNNYEELSRSTTSYKTVFVGANAMYNSTADVNTTLNYRLDFDASTDEAVYFNFEVPADYESGTYLKIKIHTSFVASTTGNAVWGIITYSAKIGVDVGTQFATTQTIASPEDAGKHMMETIITLPTSGLPASYYEAGSIITVGLYRDADNASDTYASDVSLYGASLVYQSTESSGTDIGN